MVSAVGGAEHTCMFCGATLTLFLNPERNIRNAPIETNRTALRRQVRVSRHLMKGRRNTLDFRLAMREVMQKGVLCFGCARTL